MKQITMSTLGNNGRLGNQLFQLASLMGLSHKFGAELIIPPWKYAQYFKGSFTQQEKLSAPQIIDVKEPTFKYVPDWPYIRENQCVNIWGYLQSEKYWKDIETVVRHQFSFREEFKQQCLARFKTPALQNAIAISIRRGDFVNNPNYEQLPIVSYFIRALMDNFPDWRTRSIIVFSDDIPYCRVHFASLTNVMYSENNSDIEDICLMSQCTDFIISNSTFSWWGAYLCSNPSKRVVRPIKIFRGDLARGNDESTFYPPEWEIYNHYMPDGSMKKLDLSDVTFMIPVSYDHDDRKKNLQLVTKLIQRNFNTDILICEQVFPEGHQHFNNEVRHGIRYVPFVCSKFHRTKMLNIMAENYTTREIVFNWDADVIIPPLQIFRAVEMLRNGVDVVYPYKWAFARMPRNIWFEKIWNYDDIGMVGDTHFNGMNTSDAVSLGGAVGFRRERFLAGGGENENFISYGAEDVERNIRFKKLGFDVQRVQGPNMYHMNHYVGPNSCPRHADFENNDKELEKIKQMSKEQLWVYINNNQHIR